MEINDGRNPELFFVSSFFLDFYLRLQTKMFSAVTLFY